jgi:hypothetical protein
MPAKQESHHHRQTTPDSFLGMVVHTRFSAFEVPLSLAEAVPNRIDAAEVLQPEAKTPEELSR